MRAAGSEIRSIQPTVASRLLMRDLRTVLGIRNELLFGDAGLHPLRLGAGRETEQAHGGEVNIEFHAARSRPIRLRS